MPSVLADSTGTKLSPTYTQMGSGLQVSSASKEKTNSEHSMGQLACCVSRSHSCINLRSISNYSNQQTSDIQSLLHSCQNIHNVCACLIKTSSLTHQNSNSFPKNGLTGLSASAMIPSPHLQTDIHIGSTDAVSLSTKLGKALQSVLGSSQELHLFDKLRETLKDLKVKGQKLPTYIVTQHNELQSQLQVSLLKTKVLKDKILDYEENFYKYHRLPTKKDSNHYSTLIKQQKATKHLLAQWNIML